MKLEGIVKFKQNFNKTLSIEYKIIEELNHWRNILYQHGLIGQDDNLYHGAGYGNISKRLGSPNLCDSYRMSGFVITGTQTSKFSELTPEHYSIVKRCYPKKNLIISEGPIEASSESMTHGTIYALDKNIKFVFHVHSPEIWKNAEKLVIPVTRKEVPYGTPEMAEEVKRLFKETDLKNKRILSMGGHEDGIISFGETADETGQIILEYFNKSTR